MRYLLYALLIWFLYNLVVRFIIPIYRTTRHMKKKFREMHEQMQDAQFREQEMHRPAGTPTSNPSPRSEDYIDFEEIK